MTTRKLRVGQVGVGGYGAVRRKTLRESGLFDLVAACDKNPMALEQCRQEDGARPVGSFEELLAAEGIEAVVISTGAKFHAAQAIAAMERGLHVFVEKPLCSTPEEMRRLLEVQKRTGVVVMVGHMDHQRDPMSRMIKERVASDAFGRVAYFEKTTGHRGGFCIQPGDWRGDPEKNPGGMLFQCGVHCLHELMYYFGPVRRVSATMRYDVHTTATADVALCHLEFASGLIGALNAFHVSPYRHYFNVYGTKQNLYREDRFFEEGSKLWLQNFTPNGVMEPWETLAQFGGKEGSHESYSGDVQGFHRAILSGGPSAYPTLLDGARAVAVVFAAEESARSGRAIEVILPKG